ncbi:MAG: hypothetical protein ACREP7_07010, partial [Lysobacter sp.]
PKPINPEAICTYLNEPQPASEVHEVKLEIKNRQVEVDVQPGLCYSFGVTTDGPSYILINELIDVQTKSLDIDDYI